MFPNWKDRDAVIKFAESLEQESGKQMIVIANEGRDDHRITFVERVFDSLLRNPGRVVWGLEKIEALP